VFDEERLRQENLALREKIDKASMFEEIVGTSFGSASVLRQHFGAVVGTSPVHTS
jgi:hypothetical protein